MLNLTSDYRVTLGLVAALPVILLWLYYRKVTKPYSGIPTFPGAFYFLQSYLGNFSNKLPLTANILQFLNAAAKLFEREELFLIWISFRPFVFLNSSDAVKFFFTNPAAVEKSPVYDTVKMVLGNGLATSNIKIWAKHRKIMNPTFHRKLNKRYVSVFNRTARELVQKLKRETDKPWIDIAHFMKFYAFYVVFETVLGVKEDSIVHRTSGEKLFETTAEIVEFTIHRIFRPWLRYDSLLPFFPDGRKHLHMCDYIHFFTKQIIKEMMESPEVASNKSPEEEDFDFVATKCKPFVQSFVEEHRKDPESFTLDEIEDELITIVAAGYDTTWPALTSAIYLLGLHPEIQERAYNEIELNTDDDLAYEVLLELPYLESILKEALRIYPPAPIMARHLSKDVQYGKCTVPKGANIAFFPYFCHKNPETFPNPETFDPDRFSPDKVDQYSRFSFMPFGEGPRMCIAKNFSMLELKAALAHIIRNFKIVSLDPRDKVIHKWTVVLVPVNPIRIRLVSRNCNS